MYENELNIQADGEVLPELIGRNFGRKIAEIWNEWLEDNQTRYRMATKTNRYLLELLPQPQSKTNQFAIEIDSNIFTGFTNPEKELEVFLKDALVDYREMRDGNLARSEFTRRRESKIGFGFD